MSDPRPIVDIDPDRVHTNIHFSPETRAEFERQRERIVPSTRIDGWTGARQKRFLEAVADGATVQDACRFVNMSVPAAYAFRRRARGQAFHLGWQAADLLARERIAGDLLARAVNGQENTRTRDDGSTVTTHRYDNGLALRMLDRLDRYADQSERTAPGHSARMVAAEFDAFLDLVEGEGGPARAGLFMLAREGTGEAAAAELQPVLALARADRLVRCGTTAEVPVADLDPARRATWTAEQWARAEAAGLVALAPPPEDPAPEPILPLTCSASDRSRAAPDPRLNARDLQAMDKLRRLGLPLDEDGEPEPEPDALLDSPVWWDEDALEWRTRFPPPTGFDGYESQDFGHIVYERTLTPEEEAVASERLGRAFGVVPLEEAEAERDEWFGAGDESVDPVDATSPSPAGEPGAVRPDSFDVESQAALAVAAAPGTDDTLSPAEEHSNPAPITSSDGSTPNTPIPDQDSALPVNLCPTASEASGKQPRIQLLNGHPPSPSLGRS